MKGETVVNKACMPCNEKLMIATNKYNATEKGKSRNDRYRSSDKGRASNTEKMVNYRKTAAYREHRERVRGSAVTKARNKRGNDARMSKPDQKLRSRLQSRLIRLLKGTRHNSATLFAHTEFVKAIDVADHFRSKPGPGTTIENHGTVWDREHTIPCRWYDHNDKEEVMRCWSLSNIGCMKGTDNWSKGVDIPDDATLYRVGVANWPKAWNGQIPDRDALRAKFHRDRIEKSMRAKGLA